MEGRGEIRGALVNLDMVCADIQGIGGDGELYDSGFAVDVACLVEDEVPDTVVDVMPLVVLDGL